jgi:hypothetical protein
VVLHPHIHTQHISSNPLNVGNLSCLIVWGKAAQLAHNKKKGEP